MKKKFNWRSFISFGLVYVFLVILISGIILYMAPAGRYAHWVNWKLGGLDKESWQALHTVFSYTFVILAVFHLFTINWKSFISYLRSKTNAGLKRKKELIFSSGFFLLFLFGVLFSAPPFKSVMDVSEYLTASWESVEETPPVPHAELLTLAELADQVPELTLEQITDKLDRYEISYTNTLQTLGDVAAQNGFTPMEVFRQITTQPASQLEGAGIGRKSIEEFAGELNKDVTEVLRILNESGIKAESGQTLHEIGEANDIPARDLFSLMEEV